MENSNRKRVGIILSANFSIALLQFNLASLYSFMTQQFGQGVSNLGYAGSAMFLGICIAEIPGGILEARIGARNAIVYMMLMSSISTIIGSLSSEFSLFLLSRFLVGFGIGAAFPPTIVLLTRYFRKGSEGSAIGWNALSYNFGGVVGLSGWALLGLVLGWRASLFLVGLLSVLVALILWRLIPKSDEGIQNTILSLSDLRSVFLNKKLIIITIALFGIGASSNLDSNFIVFYLETSVKASPVEAGLIGSAGPLFAIASPFIGKYYDKTGRPKMWLLASAALVTTGVVVTSINNLEAGLASSILVGIGASTGYTIGLTKAREIGKSIRSEYESIAIAWTDSISLFGGFVAPIFFSFIVIRDGYSLAWRLGGLFAFILVLPFLFSEKTNGLRSSFQKTDVST